MQDKFLIAASLKEIGRLLLVKGDNPFRAHAYERAAQAIERLDGDLCDLVDEGRLTEISGIGNALAGTIEELYRTGHSGMLDRLRKELPSGVLDLSRIPGLSL